MSASHLIRCVCCNHEAPEDESAFDEQLSGPVCKSCHFNLKSAAAWLRHCGIPRPVTRDDVNADNYKRFK